MSGFSYIELILAAAVLAIGISGAISVLGSGIHTSFDAQDSIIGLGLAQEGMELVQNVRDNAWAAGSSAQGYPDPFWKFSNSKTCRIDYSQSAVFNATNATKISCSGQYYLVPNASNLYVATNNASKFKRRIWLNQQGGGANRYYNVYSVVYWGTSDPDFSSVTNLRSSCSAVNLCVMVEAQLRNWK